MKKKFLLAIIPALLAMSSCTYMQSATAIKGNELLEDTLAHEELFDNVEFEARSLLPKRIVDDPVEHPDNDPVIGVQSFVNGDYVSFRFVAAVAFSNSNLGPTNASWTRTVSKVTTTNTTTGAYTLTYPKDTDDYEVTKAYLSLSAAGEPYTIEQFNEAHGGTEYTHFVVYTLRNVPIAENEEYYVCAYLNLSDGVSLTTKAVAVNSRRTLKVTHDRYLGAFFLTGSFTDVPVKATTSRASGDADVRATFNGIRLSKDQRFVINEFYNTKLYVKGSSTQTSGSGSGTYFEVSDNQLKAKLDGTFTYNFSYKNSEALETSCTRVVRPIYLYITTTDWFTSNALTKLYAFGYTGPDSSKVEAWLELESVTISGKTYLKTVLDVDTDVYKTVIVVRIDPDFNNHSSDDPWDYKWSQTSNLDLHYNDEDCAYVYGNIWSSVDSSIGKRD